MDDRELDEHIAHIETLLEAVEALPEASTRATAEETVRTLLALYGEGLARLLEHVAQLGGEDAVRALAADRLIAYLLLLHGLHPLGVEERVASALEEVRPYLRSHGGNVELLGIEGGVARLRLQGSCHGCPSSAMTLKSAIEEAITRIAPDLIGIEAQGVAEQRVPQPVTLVPRAQRQEERASWSVIGALPQLASGGLLAREIEGESVLFLRLGRDYYAYQDRCPGCHASLAKSRLLGAELTCGGCGHVYDVQRAGRCLDAPHLHLEPIPLLLSETGLVKIALARRVG